jgi:transcriptional regulator with XRE-family HTH domain
VKKMTSIAGSLKKLRKAKKMSQKDLARVLNMSPSTLGMYETSKREPDYQTLSKIASYFGVSTDYMLGIEPQEGDTGAERVENNFGIRDISRDEAEIIALMRQHWGGLSMERKKKRFGMVKFAIRLVEEMEEKS